MSHIHITGDTHGPIDIPKLGTKKWSEGRYLTKDDYLIITGDFGLVWDVIPGKEEKYLTKWLTEKKWTTLFVCGNHENHTRLYNLPVIDMFGGRVGKVNDSIYHLKRGEIYTIAGKKFFCMGGADSIDKNHRREGISWWASEIPSYSEMDYAIINLLKHQNKVDYIITHTLPQEHAVSFGYVRRHDNFDPTRKFLQHVYQNVSFEKWYCGHFHVDEERGQFRMLYNDIICIV